MLQRNVCKPVKSIRVPGGIEVNADISNDNKRGKLYRRKFKGFGKVNPRRVTGP